MSKFDLHDKVKVKKSDYTFEVQLISYDTHSNLYSYSKIGKGAKYYEEKELELVERGDKK